MIILLQREIKQQSAVKKAVNLQLFAFLLLPHQPAYRQGKSAGQKGLVHWPAAGSVQQASHIEHSKFETSIREQDGSAALEQVLYQELWRTSTNYVSVATG
jgi:hypothetical protein